MCTRARVCVCVVVCARARVCVCARRTRRRRRRSLRNQVLTRESAYTHTQRQLHYTHTKYTQIRNAHTLNTHTHKRARRVEEAHSAFFSLLPIGPAWWSVVGMYVRLYLYNKYIYLYVSMYYGRPFTFIARWFFFQYRIPSLTHPRLDPLHFFHPRGGPLTLVIDRIIILLLSSLLCEWIGRSVQDNNVIIICLVPCSCNIL